MFKIFVDRELEKEKLRLKRIIDELESKNCLLKQQHDLNKQEAINKLREEMQKALITSDLERTEAVAKLEMYEKFDTKEDAKVIKDLLKSLVEMVGKQKEINVLK